MNLRRRDWIRTIWMRGALVLLSMGCISSLLAQQESGEQTPTFRASTSLVLVDVVAQEAKSGLPVRGLRREDFKVFDNKTTVPISTFDSGSRYETRPLALWFVVQCNGQNQSRTRSGLLAGHESLFRSALNSLLPTDTVGVAWWCDSGESKLELPPTTDRDLAIRKLALALQPIPFIAPRGARIGELAAQEMFRSIIRDTRRRNPQPLPVAVLFYGDITGMPLDELDVMVNDFLETSGIVFGVKDASIPEMYELKYEQGAVFHYMAEETGGQYLKVTPELYSAALESIIIRLHFRYQIGFKPPTVDGKRHQLRVELVGDAKGKYKGARLRYRPTYIPVATLPGWLD